MMNEMKRWVLGLSFEQHMSKPSQRLFQENEWIGEMCLQHRYKGLSDSQICQHFISEMLNDFGIQHQKCLI